MTITAGEARAEIYQDGRLIGRAPFELKVRDGERVKLTLRADGYSDRDVSFTVVENTQVYTFAMRRIR